VRNGFKVDYEPVGNFPEQAELEMNNIDYEAEEVDFAEENTAVTDVE